MLRSAHDKQVGQSAGAPKVYVHLAYDQDAAQWARRFERGLATDRVPYGYDYATEFGCDVRFSSQRVVEGPARRALRQRVFQWLGFDLIHAWRNRKAMFNADVIWTHTEKQWMAAALLLRLGLRRRPRLLAQSVWLFDQWEELSRPRRWLYGWLSRRADVLTFLSPENMAVAREILPKSRVEFVPFGVSTRSFPLRQSRKAEIHQPLRAVAVGSDMHRDWKTLLEAVALYGPEIELRVASMRPPPAALAPNVTWARADTLQQVHELYDWADVAVVPLLPNKHASGITVCLEAMACGVPVIASDTGGLRAYFPDGEAMLTPPQRAQQLAEALRTLGGDASLAQRLAGRAMQAIAARGYTSRDFVRRHCEISMSPGMWTGSGVVGGRRSSCCADPA